ncbi:N-acetylglucosamine-1-phosphodiester alpha-N-acetylglucosaminidase isoform X3 [Apodemus sylvaticus]|uniref:N-acetylglucosamine-1-phosphodiester alpha-N-acetylglucosaminidase isoform X3 n=1 Tax=Apodemus sylvaticus TaxID=10129 RepID=UPI0022426CD7|nr:N-acetylglucosamine-1-phosphodiester alpha-N-acetylglucosaminidase isoform X3 [Apodemus sylvaticus]
MAAPRGPGLFFIPALLGLLGVAWCSLSFGVSRDDDLLLPYTLARRRPSRDCARVRAGSPEQESWPPPPSNPGASHRAAVRTFVSHFEGRAVAGHLTRVTDPLRTFSVLEPGGPGGCAQRRRATVEDTAVQAGCRVAQNGGFFRMDTGECLGNVVSDGQLVSSSGGLQNAQFGIRRDGTLVTGYLSEAEVLDTVNPFVQLLSGVVWLIRNGSIYINESQATECDKTQETGSFSKFVNVISARTAVGHDRKGQLILFHADGQTEQRGLNLWEMAEFLLRQDVVNAINLDGGGSATFVLNGTLASYPSDHCESPTARTTCGAVPAKFPLWCVCMNPAASHPTAVAMGPVWMATANAPAASGGVTPAASWTVAPPTAASMGCAQRVTGCRCDAGWTGSNCSEECPLGWYGPGCQRPCQCEHQCPCDPQTGNCSISQVKQCLQPSEATPRAGELASFTRAERNRHLHGDYVYHPLQDVNGEVLALEKEQTEETCNPFKD